ncbi:unnamed protein product [Ixodes pacificus]
MSAESDADPIHPHCLNCISIVKCNARSEQRKSCQIVACKLDCGASFHSCKCQEHQLLCPNVKVPCSNAVNGCPALLLRSQLGSHLQHCPASILSCTVEWNRWILDTGDGARTECSQYTGRLQLDLALAMRDLRSLRQGNGGTCKTAEGVACWESAVSFSLHHSVHPQADGAVEATRLYTALVWIRAVSRECCLQSSTSTSQIYSDYAYLTKHFQMQLQNGQAAPQLRNCDAVDKSREGAPDAMNVDECSVNSGGNCGVGDYRLLTASGTCYLSKPLATPEVELHLEFLTRYQTKPESLHTFPSTFRRPRLQGFRRDEYAWHYQNVHRDIHGGLNGWLEQRCPLAQYGCGFSRRRFVPAPRGTEIVHSELLESFGVTFTAQHRRSRSPESRQGAAESSRSSVCSSQGPPMCNGHNEPRRAPRRGRELEFTDFPDEVLEHIAQFLDGFSLNNFSLVSQRCRDVSCSLLESRGMVVLKWERQAAGWRVGSKRWFFSNAFTPISKWYFSEEDNMSNHLKDCPFFKRNIKTMPHYCFTLHNGMPSSNRKRKELLQISF